MRRKVEQEGYLQESPKANQPTVAASFQKNNPLMGFAHAPPSQLPPAGQPPVNNDYSYYHISEAQNVSHSWEFNQERDGYFSSRKQCFAAVYFQRMFYDHFSLVPFEVDKTRCDYPWFMDIKIRIVSDLFRITQLRKLVLSTIQTSILTCCSRLD